MFNIKKSIWNWGMEDTLHASILRQSGLEQIRRRANNLIHFYHERYSSSGTDVRVTR
jgi:hypothetical protein